MIKPIQTEYKGYLFRSRNEARWAIFFDTLGIRYNYEVEGYDLGGLWYLPDFWLPDLKYWIEVKGIKPNGVEEEKARRLCQMHGGDLVLIFTAPWYTEPALAYLYLPNKFTFPNDPDFRNRLLLPNVVEKTEWFWCECPKCGKIGVCPDGNPGTLNCYCMLDKVLGTLNQIDGAYDGCQFLQRMSKLPITRATPRLVRAFTAARQARFENRQTLP